MLISLVAFALAGIAQAPAEVFEAAGLFHVATPEGYAWKLANEGERDGVLYRAYLCAREGSPTRVVVTVEGRVVATQPERVAAVKGHWNGMLEMLQQSGFKKPETRRPDVEAPVPDRVAYGLSADDPSGNRRQIRCVTVFGARNIYLIQGMAASVEEADLLMKTMESFKELP